MGPFRPPPLNAFARDLANFRFWEENYLERPGIQHTCTEVPSGWRRVVRCPRSLFDPNLKSVSDTWKKSHISQNFENRKFGIWHIFLWTPGIKIIFWWKIVKWKTWPHFYWFKSNISQIGENNENFEVTPGILAMGEIPKIRYMRAYWVIFTWRAPEIENSRT